jgi:hypothetical protein
MVDNVSARELSSTTTQLIEIKNSSLFISAGVHNDNEEEEGKGRSMKRPRE